MGHLTSQEVGKWWNIRKWGKRWKIRVLHNFKEDGADVEVKKSEGRKWNGDRDGGNLGEGGGGTRRWDEGGGRYGEEEGKNLG